MHATRVLIDTEYPKYASSFRQASGPPAWEPLPVQTQLERITSGIGAQQAHSARVAEVEARNAEALAEWATRMVAALAMIDRLAQVAPIDDAEPARDALFSLLKSFPSALRGWQRRSGSPVKVENEADLQLYVEGLLWTLFDDVRPEDPIPKHANTSTRIDFVLPTPRIALELKLPRVSQPEREVRDELIVDAQTYADHPDCDEVVALVYDPNQRISNDAAFMKDLSNSASACPLHVVVVR